MLENPSPKSHAPWPSWVATLRRYRLENIVAWLLEASGPWAIIGAQMIYIGEPLLQPFVETDQMEALANLLEDRDEGRAFLKYLQEEPA